MARAAAVGAPPTAGVGCRAATSWRESGTVGRPAKRAPERGTQVDQVVQPDHVGVIGHLEVAAQRSERPGDALDHQPVLVPVLARLLKDGRQQAARRPPRPLGRSGQGTAVDGGSPPLDQQLGAGPHEPAVRGRHREDGAVGFEVVPAAEKAGYVDGLIDGGVDMAG